MLAGLLIVFAAIAAFPAYAVIVVIIAVLVALKLSAYRSLGRRDSPPTVEMGDSQDAPPQTGLSEGPTRPCPQCHATILEVDDVCPGCGAIVGMDSEPASDTEAKH
jgi:hypothetical protein